MYIVESDPSFETDFSFELVGSEEELRATKEGFVCALLGMKAMEGDTHLEYHTVMKLAFSQRTTVYDGTERQEFIDFLAKRETSLAARGRVIAAEAMAGRLTTAQFMEEQQRIKTASEYDAITILRHDGVQYADRITDSPNNLDILGDDPEGISEHTNRAAILTNASWCAYQYSVTRKADGTVDTINPQMQYTVGDLTEDGEYTAVASVLDYHKVGELYRELQERADLSDIT